MKKGILLVIGFSFNGFICAGANDINMNQLLVLGTILHQLEPVRPRLAPTVAIPQATHARTMIEQAQARYKTLKRNQPPRSHKRQQ